MASLTDLFNPTFLMFLGILVLVVALLVVYFEGKIRDQNHKIASMLSLVSTMADDMHGVKMGLNHLAIRGGQVQDIHLREKENLGNSQKNKLIEVSDDDECENDEEYENDNDEESENDNDEESENDNDEESENDNDEESDDNDEESDDNEEIEEIYDNEELQCVDDSDNNREDSKHDIKIVKLQVSNENNINDSYEENNNLDFDTEDLDELDANFEQDVDNQYLDLKYQPDEKHLEESDIPSLSDLKTISINLGADQYNIDYKKLQLAKLRSIVVEKGLSSNSEASKLKKPELLKLLGAE
jgi:hypothetical protein